MSVYPVVAIVGPTATGKTRLAALLANQIDAEIISADSRQVYKQMDIGTGKDFNDYLVNGKNIPYHLIDIVEPGYKYSVFEYQQELIKTYKAIQLRSKNCIVCGGSGLYVEAALGLKIYHEVKKDEALHKSLSLKSEQELIGILQSVKMLHNTTDTTDKERLIRAIEIANAEKNMPDKSVFPFSDFLIFMPDMPAEGNRMRIKERLNQRLQQGLIEEVEQLISNGVSIETLQYYGLEYRYISLYLCGKLSFDEMKEKLFFAISDFAKRQRTWYRRMEKKGLHITRLDGNCTPEENAASIYRQLEKYAS